MSCAVILTSSSVEYLAIRAYLTHLQYKFYCQGIFCEQGIFSAEGISWDIGVVEFSVHNSSTALEVSRLIASLNPEIILSIGITANLKEAAALGDVVVSTKVCGYEAGTIEGILLDISEMGVASSRLEEQARLPQNKTDSSKETSQASFSSPKILVAPIADGERATPLIKSEVVQFLQAHYEATLAAGEIPVLMIWGISDLLHRRIETDKKSDQNVAAHNASQFAFEILTKFRLAKEAISDIEQNVIQDNGVAQNNVDNAKGWQTFVQGGTAYVGEFHIHETPAGHHKLVSQPLNSSGLISVNSVSFPNNLPRSGVIDFCGRQEVQSQIYEQLQDDTFSLNTLAIVGMGGVGKTEVALQYALNNLQVYPGGLCWIYGRNQDIAGQIIRFARIYLQVNPSEDLSPEDQVRFCWNYWSLNTSLIIFDDVSDYELIKPFLPPNEPRFKVLLTSRSRMGSSIRHLLLEPLDETAAIAVLKSLTDEERIQGELETAKQICKWLGYLPLGLELTGRYLRHRSELSLVVLQQRLEEKKLSARAISQAEQDMTRPSSISATFELSWEELSNEAKSLAYTLGLFAASPIPWSLVQQCLSNWEVEDLEDIREESLLSSHLLCRNGNDTYRLHQLIREFLREKTQEVDPSHETQRSLANKLSLLAGEIPETLTYESLLQLGTTIPHIVEVTESLTPHIDTDYFTYPFQGLGRYYEGSGFYNQAKTVYERCLSLSKERFGAKHINAANSMSNLASIHYVQGNYEEAEILQRESLSIKRERLGEESLGVADILNNLALTLEERGDYAEAEKFYIRSMTARSNLVGRNHYDFTDSLNNLGVLYSSQGHYAKAEQLILEALETRKTLLGQQHPRVATCLNNLASCYYNQQRFEDAEKLYAEALSLYKSVHQIKHRDIAIALNNLAQVYSQQGKYSAATPLLQEALDIQEAIFGHEHPDIATSLNNLAALHEDSGKVDEAEEIYKKVLAMRRKILGDQSIDVAISLNNLAKFFYTNKRYKEAESLYVESLSILEQKLEAEHPLLERINTNLSELRSFLDEPSV